MSAHYLVGLDGRIADLGRTLDGMIGEGAYATSGTQRRARLPHIDPVVLRRVATLQLRHDVAVSGHANGRAQGLGKGLGEQVWQFLSGGLQQRTVDFPVTLPAGSWTIAGRQTARLICHARLDARSHAGGARDAAHGRTGNVTCAVGSRCRSRNSNTPLFTSRMTRCSEVGSFSRLKASSSPL